jgi:hypothetical protein
MGCTGTGRGEDEVPDDRVTLREASERLGVSEGAIRKRVKRKTLRSELGTDGRRYVFLNGEDNGDGRGEDVGTDALIAELRENLAYLRSQLDQEREANRENRRIIAGLVQRVPELDAPPGPAGAPDRATEDEGGGQVSPEHEQPPERRRSWWREFFGFGG